MTQSMYLATHLSDLSTAPHHTMRWRHKLGGEAALGFPAPPSGVRARTQYYYKHPRSICRMVSAQLCDMARDPTRNCQIAPPL